MPRKRLTERKAAAVKTTTADININEKTVKSSRLVIAVILLIIAAIITFILYKTNSNIGKSVLISASVISGVVGLVIIIAAYSVNAIIKRCSTPVLARLVVNDPNNPILTYKFKNKKYKRSTVGIKQPSTERLKTIVNKGMTIYINPNNPYEVRSAEEKDARKLNTIGYSMILAAILAAFAAFFIF